MTKREKDVEARESQDKDLLERFITRLTRGKRKPTKRDFDKVTSVINDMIIDLDNEIFDLEDLRERLENAVNSLS